MQRKPHTNGNADPVTKLKGQRSLETVMLMSLSDIKVSLQQPQGSLLFFSDIRGEFGLGNAAVKLTEPDHIL